jgi:ketosteroid isomerase-like protein
MANTGYIEFEIAGAAVSRAEPVAWVTCIERITTAGAGGASAVAEIAATNLFVPDASGWRIALHHASPVVRPAPAEA